ncbi:VOC family protein [Mycolicibacterium rhodesiae]|uniref:Glyoxalase n=1 Tax=Mycolicibacterium rhodesiae TaxID=36814 RepID=A0A1X0IX01_MYCRH|nr:glyoxalase [Mycolicibacterium rhodesiae]MCV7346504.1 glyoxalase [Mycolicibacterium rhodesiae]ORB53748.1 glyoxalase [Mycolicibacterium rhodesiae]
MTVTIDEIHVGDPASAWRDAGFTVDTDSVARIGDVRVRLGGRGSGIVEWSLRGLPADGHIDGIPTTSSVTDTPEPAVHPNGVTEIDHVVLLSPNLSRTVSSLSAIGLKPRRERDAELGGQPMRQIFFRLGPVILEVVGSPGATGGGPSSLWGITYVVTDIDATAAFFGDHALRVKDAVQPGRRITTVKHRDLGMSVRTAMISPPILGA